MKKREKTFGIKKINALASKLVLTALGDLKRCHLFNTHHMSVRKGCGMMMIRAKKKLAANILSHMPVSR